MRIRWLKKLSGEIELQAAEGLGDNMTWSPVEMVTERSEADIARDQRIAAEFGMTPALVTRLREAGYINLPTPVPG